MDAFVAKTQNKSGILTKRNLETLKFGADMSPFIRQRIPNHLCLNSSTRDEKDMEELISQVFQAVNFALDAEFKTDLTW